MFFRDMRLDSCDIPLFKYSPAYPVMSIRYFAIMKHMPVDLECIQFITGEVLYIIKSQIVLEKSG